MPKQIFVKFITYSTIFIFIVKRRGRDMTRQSNVICNCGTLVFLF